MPVRAGVSGHRRRPGPRHRRRRTRRPAGCPGLEPGSAGRERSVRRRRRAGRGHRRRPAPQRLCACRRRRRQRLGPGRRDRPAAARLHHPCTAGQARRARKRGPAGGERRGGGEAAAGAGRDGGGGGGRPGGPGPAAGREAGPGSGGGGAAGAGARRLPAERTCRSHVRRDREAARAEG
jgi:translation initiation factor IF-2